MLKDTLKSLILIKQQEIPFQLIDRDEDLPINSNAIVTVPGVRRCGKSTKMLLIINKLFKEGVTKDRILWMRFDDERLSDMKAQDLDMVLDAYRELYPNNNLSDVYMFFDELQFIDQWELFVVRVFKTYCKKIYISGSNAKMLSREIGTALRGWALEFETFPLSFSEYCRFTDVKTSNLTEQQTVQLRMAWDKYNHESAFPEIVLTQSQSLKELKLQGYFNAMLFRDIVERYHIGNVMVLRYFIKCLMNNLTKPTSINAIYNDLRSQGRKSSRDELYKWCDYLCDCYMFFRVPKYTHSLIGEQQSLRKYYFIDNGMRQSVLLPQSGDDGKLLENSVFLYLMRKKGAFDKISYYLSGKECDFVVQQHDQVVQLIQVCWSMDNDSTRQREIEGLMYASEATNCDNLLIITHDEEYEMLMNGKNVRVIPAYKWMLE